MRLQHERRINPYPWTWEVPVAAIIGILLVVALAMHPARATANLVAGGGWHLTSRTELFTTIPGLLAGDSTTGLPPLAAYASATELYVWLIVFEVAVLSACGWFLRAAMVRWGPQRIRGMATPSEAEAMLGVSRLRRSAAIIRPDLYGEEMR